MTGLLRSLKSGNAMHKELQGILEKNFIHMASHYEKHLRAIEIPYLDQLLLEQLCQSLSSVHRA